MIDSKWEKAHRKCKCSILIDIAVLRLNFLPIGSRSIKKKFEILAITQIANRSFLIQCRLLPFFKRSLTFFFTFFNFCVFLSHSILSSLISLSLVLSVLYSHSVVSCCLHNRGITYILIHKKALRTELLCIYSISCSDVHDVISSIFSYLPIYLLMHFVKKNYGTEVFFRLCRATTTSYSIAFYRKKNYFGFFLLFSFFANVVVRWRYKCYRKRLYYCHIRDYLLLLNNTCGVKKVLLLFSQWSGNTDLCN